MGSISPSKVEERSLLLSTSSYSTAGSSSSRTREAECGKGSEDVDLRAGGLKGKRRTYERYPLSLYLLIYFSNLDILVVCIYSSLYQGFQDGFFFKERGRIVRSDIYIETYFNEYSHINYMYGVLTPRCTSVSRWIPLHR